VGLLNVFSVTDCVRVRFADFTAVTRAITLPAPVAATSTLAEVAEELAWGVFADHPDLAVATRDGL